MDRRTVRLAKVMDLIVSDEISTQLKKQEMWIIPEQRGYAPLGVET
jgi:hypothetical protein